MATGQLITRARKLTVSFWRSGAFGSSFVSCARSTALVMIDDQHHEAGREAKLHWAPRTTTTNLILMLRDGYGRPHGQPMETRALRLKLDDDRDEGSEGDEAIPQPDKQKGSSTKRRHGTEALETKQACGELKAVGDDTITAQLRHHLGDKTVKLIACASTGASSLATCYRRACC